MWWERRSCAYWGRRYQKAMSKGAKRYIVVKVVRLTKEEARRLKELAVRWKCSEAEAVRIALSQDLD